MSDSFFKALHYAAIEQTKDFSVTNPDEDAVTLTDAIKAVLVSDYPQVNVRVELAKDLLTVIGDEDNQPNNGYFIDFFIRDGRLVYRMGGSVNQAV